MIRGQRDLSAHAAGSSASVETPANIAHTLSQMLYFCM
jgi:hypothetical protein